MKHCPDLILQFSVKSQLLHKQKLVLFTRLQKNICGGFYGASRHSLNTTWRSFLLGQTTAHLHTKLPEPETGARLSAKTPRGPVCLLSMAWWHGMGWKPPYTVPCSPRPRENFGVPVSWKKKFCCQGGCVIPGSTESESVCSHLWKSNLQKKIH